jgi:hypothetical protein
VLFSAGKDFEKFYTSPPEDDPKDDEDDSSSEEDLGDIDDRAPLRTSGDTSDRYAPETSRPTTSYPGGSGSGGSWLSKCNWKSEKHKFFFLNHLLAGFGAELFLLLLFFVDTLLEP